MSSIFRFTLYNDTMSEEVSCILSHYIKVTNIQLLMSNGGRAQHDFSLAWLEAVRYVREGGHGMTGKRSVQERLWKMCITALP